MLGFLQPKKGQNFLLHLLHGRIGILIEVGFFFRTGEHFFWPLELLEGNEFSVLKFFEETEVHGLVLMSAPELADGSNQQGVIDMAGLKVI